MGSYEKEIDRGDDVTPARGVPLPRVHNAPARVLVVDDDQDIVEFMADALSAEGHDVRTATNIAAMMAAVEAEVPEIVVLDLLVEAADGAEVARALRERHPGVQLVFVTGLPRRGAMVARAFGAPLVAKPFRLTELTSAVRAVQAVLDE
jgi:DNA-binding response OmpR family regulator